MAKNHQGDMPDTPKRKPAAKPASKAAKPAAALTARQEAFVREYLTDLNATQAAIRAGYAKGSANVTAHRLLMNANVAAEIAKHQAQRSSRLDITADKVIAELAKIGFADIRDVVRWGDTVTDEDGDPIHGLALLASDRISDNTAAAIAEISETTTGLKIKLHDKRAALVDIGRHLGMFTDKVEHSGGIQVSSTVTFVEPPTRGDDE